MEGWEELGLGEFVRIAGIDYELEGLDEEKVGFGD